MNENFLFDKSLYNFIFASFILIPLQQILEKCYLAASQASSSILSSLVVVRLSVKIEWNDCIIRLICDWFIHVLFLRECGFLIIQQGRNLDANSNMQGTLY